MDKKVLITGKLQGTKTPPKKENKEIKLLNGVNKADYRK